MAKLHPIAEQLGYRTNEEFYRDYPTQESYEMAMGGSPYVGQPTYDQFLSFGPPTKQVPFYQGGGETDDSGIPYNTAGPREDVVSMSDRGPIDFGAGSVSKGFAMARAMNLPIGSVFRIGGKDYLYKYAKGDPKDPSVKKANVNAQRSLPVSNKGKKNVPAQVSPAPVKKAPVQVALAPTQTGIPFRNTTPYNPYDPAIQFKQQPASRKPVVAKQPAVTKSAPKSLPKQKVNVKDYGALDFNTSPEVAASTSVHPTYKLPNLSNASPKVKAETRHADILLNESIPADVRETYRRNISNRGYNKPYLIVSKTDSKQYAFDKDHNLVKVTTVLTGKGKSNKPNTADPNLPLTGANAEAATTPIGRYLILDPPKKGTPEYNEDVSHYGAAARPLQPLDNQYYWGNDMKAYLAMHGTYQKELQRRNAALRSLTPSDNNMSYGCVNQDCSDLYDLENKVNLTNDTMYVTDPSIKFNMSPLELIKHEYGGNVKQYLKDVRKSFVSKKQEGGEPGKGVSIDDYVKNNSNYLMSYLQGNVMENLDNEVREELDQEFNNEFMRYGGLPKALNGNQGLKDQAFQMYKDQHDKNLAEEQADVDASDKAREALGEPRKGMSEATARAAIGDPLKSGKFNREIEEDLLSGEEKANLMLAGISGTANFFRGNETRNAEEYEARRTLGDNVFGTKRGGNRGDWTQGAMFTGSNFRPNQQLPVQFTGQGLYEAQYGGMSDQFGGMIQYDTIGNQMLPVALSGLQVKMNPGLGNSTYNANQLAWPFHPDVMSAPPVRSRRDLTAVPREEANVEAEGGETVVTNFTGDAIPENYNIKGPRHTHGGVPLSLPEDAFIYSDTAKMKIKDPTILKQFGMSAKKGGYTPAQISKKYDINKYKKILNDPDSDEIQVATAEKMISDYNLKLAKLALVQESKKGFPQGLPQVAQPYIEQMNMDPNMVFGEQGMETETDEEQMRYGGDLPKAYGGYNNSPNSTLSRFAKNPYMQRFLRGREDQFEREQRQKEKEAANQNQNQNNQTNNKTSTDNQSSTDNKTSTDNTSKKSGSNKFRNKYVPLNYGYGDYTGAGIQPIPGAGRNFSYEFSSNDPNVKSPDFLKDTNITGLKVNQRNPSAIGSLFRPRKTSIEMTFDYSQGDIQTAQGATNQGTTQANATQTNTQPAAQTSTAQPATKQVSPEERQQQILNAANPFGPYNTSQGSYFYPKAPIGQGVNQGLYPPYESAPNFEYGGMYELPIAQVGFTNATQQAPPSGGIGQDIYDVATNPWVTVPASMVLLHKGYKAIKPIIQKTKPAKLYKEYTDIKKTLKDKNLQLSPEVQQQYVERKREIGNIPKQAVKSIYGPTIGKVVNYAKKKPMTATAIGTLGTGTGISLYQLPEKQAQREADYQRQQAAAAEAAKKQKARSVKVDKFAPDKEYNF